MQKSTIFLIAIIIILVVILMLDRCSGKRDYEGRENIYNTYVTDTLVSDQAYKTLLEKIEGLDAKWEKTPADPIIYYATPDPQTVTIEKVPDSILVYIGKLEERLAISDKYIKNWPNADKLIDFQLNRDEFDITTLSIAGETKQTHTPLYLDQYNYYWDNNTLYHELREDPYEPQKPRNVWNQLYINSGYDFIHAAPQFGVEYSWRINRFKLSAESYSLFHTNGALLYGNVKLGYRLFK